MHHCPHAYTFTQCFWLPVAFEQKFRCSSFGGIRLSPILCYLDAILTVASVSREVALKKSLGIALTGHSVIFRKCLGIALNGNSVIFRHTPRVTIN